MVSYSLLDMAGSPGPGETIAADKALADRCGVWLCCAGSNGDCIAAALASREGSVISGGGGLDMRAKELMFWLSGKFPGVMGAPVHM